VVGQPAQVCAELRNYAATDQTVDAILYVADFGMGLPFQEVGSLTDWVIPANSTSKRCLPWTPTPGGTHRCLQILIQQRGYEDIISQRNIDLQPPLAGKVIGQEITIGNPTGQTGKVEVNIKTIGLPVDWNVRVGWTEAELQPGQTMTNTITIEPAPGAPASIPGDEAVVAVEAFIGQELIGGIQLEFETSRRYLPIILKKAS
jgi:hypothetical protein